MRILSISPAVPRPDQASGDRRFLALLEMTARLHEVDLAVLWEGATEANRQYRRRCEDAGVRVLPPGMGAVERAACLRAYDVFLCEFWRTAESVMPLFRKTQPWAEIVVDSVDVHFLREEAWAAVGGIEPAIVCENRRRELAVYRQADLVVVVTEEDRLALKAAGCSGPSALLPNVVPPRGRPAMQREEEILFVGGFNHPPNADGILWFARDVFPVVRRRRPAARLRIVGSNVPAAVEALAVRRGSRSRGTSPIRGLSWIGPRSPWRPCGSARE